MYYLVIHWYTILDTTDFHQLGQSNNKFPPEAEKTESKDWLCNVCDQQFENVDILKWHLYTIHNFQGKCSLRKYIPVSWKDYAMLGKNWKNTFVTIFVHTVRVINVLIAGTKILLAYRFTWQNFGLKLSSCKKTLLSY